MVEDYFFAGLLRSDKIGCESEGRHAKESEQCEKRHGNRKMLGTLIKLKRAQD